MNLSKCLEVIEDLNVADPVHLDGLTSCHRTLEIKR